MTVTVTVTCDSPPQGQEPEKFFVSAGFALTHPSSVTDITAIEAVRVEELDEAAVSCACHYYKHLCAGRPLNVGLGGGVCCLVVVVPCRC